MRQAIHRARALLRHHRPEPHVENGLTIRRTSHAGMPLAWEPDAVAGERSMPPALAAGPGACYVVTCHARPERTPGAWAAGLLRYPGRPHAPGPSSRAGGIDKFDNVRLAGRISWQLRLRVFTKMLDVTGIGAGKIDTDQLQSMDIYWPNEVERQRIVLLAGPLIEAIRLNQHTNDYLAE